MATASSALPLEEEHQAPAFHQIIDIFDAPSRLGESSKLLMKSSSARMRTSRPARPASSAPIQNGSTAVQPLPTPIIFDGPARFHPTGATLIRSQSTAAANHARHALPAPETFDGPSRLRSTSRSGPQPSDPSAWLFSPSTLVVLGLFGAASLFEWSPLNIDHADLDASHP
ncbi:hypothetical protein WOLCODRAFT_28809 [Wolfiporia cocos MD-104 SS10]|uniref:Uncharacterized protein n=1 Tax=Wolfiporia cocos (strain MD-104) TaxID=742152 RepID=A0A2H3J5C6_WOLCO|nr:hypothetical protein WOLCODRAFT_28809 [Wolfiporia cocos MD-104 SS10]